MASKGSAFEIRILRRQSRGTVKNPAKDRLIEAMYPGKRISKNKKPYWETRPNRSDIDKKSKVVNLMASPFKNIKHGALHRWLGKPQASRISMSTLQQIKQVKTGNKWRGKTVTAHRKRQVNFAINSRGWNH